MTIQKDKPSIGFSGVMSMLFTIITIVLPDTFQIAESTWEIFWLKVVFLVGMYFFLSLISGDISEVGELLTQILIIRDEDEYELTEKIVLIKDQLNLYTNHFSKIFTEVRKISNGGKKFHAIREEVKTTLNRMYKGRLTPAQFVWDVAYAVYRILISNNYFQIALPIDVILSISFVGGLQLTSGRITGLGKLVGDILKSSKTEEQKEKLILGKIIHTIRMICLGYNRVAKYIEKLTGKQIYDFLSKACLTPEIEE